MAGIGESANQRVSESKTSPFADSQSLLEHLERANLFLVPLDNHREWYRYHHIFADLLRYRLRRACRWHADAGDPDEAMRHALAIPDPALAADLAEQHMLYAAGDRQQPAGDLPGLDAKYTGDGHL